MAWVTRGNLTAIFSLVFLAGLLLGSGCLGTKGREISPTGEPAGPSQTVPARVPSTPSPIPRASPVQISSADPIIGTWYAPSPDDLTFEFFPDGTFLERSPNFQPYRGTWKRSEEDFYDAMILDQWGYKKPAHFLLATGTLYTKGIGAFHRVVVSG